jgi:hypothetical protein
MSAGGISEEVIGGIILATIIWIGGILFQWLVSRNNQIAALRKYERLRAKVEVLSRLTTIEVDDRTDTMLNQRQRSLIRSELNSVLDELEREEEGTIRGAVRLSDLVKSLRLGPSFGVWAVLTKALFYATTFVTLCVLAIFLLVLVNPPPTGGSDRQTLFVGACLIMFPFFVITLLSYWLAKRVHVVSVVTAQIVEQQTLSTNRNASVCQLP